MTFGRTVCAWLLLAALITVAAGCDEDVFIAPTLDDPPASPISILLLPDKATYGVGESVVTSVRIENATNVGTVLFRWRYNRAVLQYVDSVEGTFMSSDGADTVFLASPTAGDEIGVRLSRPRCSQGASGRGWLATLEFLAVGAGDGGFAFSAGDVRDPQGQSLPAIFSNVSVLVMP